MVGTLIRRDDANAEHSIRARLTSVKARSKAENLLYQPVELTFESVEYPWIGALRAGTASPVPNSGNAPYAGVVWTITAGGGAPCTAVDFLAGPDSAGRIWHWHWTGSITAGTTLVIDCGAMTVKTGGGANAYSTFALQASHNQNSWTEAMPGALGYSMTLTGAGATHSFQSYDAYQ